MSVYHHQQDSGMLNYAERKLRLVLRTLLFLLWGLVPYTVTAQTLEERITSILSQMTMEEKIKQLYQDGEFRTGTNSRLGIPGFVMADGPHGVRDGMATSFPVGIGMASTWDRDLAERIGTAMGREFRGKGKHQALGPCLDIDRDPRNGRTPETGGEDPYLCAQITTAVVKGMQTQPVIATVKHYNANHRENGRTTNNIIASQRVLHDHAGLAFRTAVQQGGALSVMNAYNRINGEQCAESPTLLTTILREHWGFPYYVVSDWGSIWNSEKAIRAGCDICMGADNYRNDLPSLVSSGTLPSSVIDEAVRRVLRTKLVAGMLDYQPPGNPADVNSLAHQQLCLEAGRKSLVLLKNQGNILPLSKNPAGYIALIGPSANVLQVDGTGSAYVTPFYSITPRQGIEQLIGAGKVQYAKGCDINSADTSGFSSAVAIARNADAVVFCGGLDQTQEGEGSDRVGGSITLPGKQQDLINALAAANPNVVVVLFSGGVCGIERSVDNIRGLIQAFYPGQEGGRAVAEALFGDVNPGGKLPVTYPKNDAQLPPWNDSLEDDYGCGYRWFDQMSFVPLFPFGHGLSYTTFGYSNLSVSPAVVAPGEPVTVSLDVANSGARSGDEVVQLYLTELTAPDLVPVKQLKAFRRVSIGPGGTERVIVTLTADELYNFNEATGQYDVRAGTYAVRIGGSSANLPLNGTFQVTDGTRKPDLTITGLRMVPPYPLPGQRVIFLASVKNQGSAPIQGSGVKANFTVNGETVSWSDGFSGLLVPGGMALICGNRGPADTSTWAAGGVGSYTVGALVDPDNTIDECVETNNSSSVPLSVFSAPRPNLALYKSVSVTSVERAGLEGQYAVDGDMGSRWSSAFSDPQILTVDLGGRFFVDDVVLYWETAYAREFYLKISDGTGAWMDVRHETNGTGGMATIPVGATASKVMMAGIQRATSYGYSLFELQVHGSPVNGVEAGTGGLPREYSLSEAFPNPFNPTTVIRYQLPVASEVKLSAYDLLGREVAVLVDEPKAPGSYEVRFDGTGLASGVYLCKLTAGRFVETRKLALIR
jgi:beta-glucosidase